MAPHTGIEPAQSAVTRRHPHQGDYEAMVAAPPLLADLWGGHDCAPSLGAVLEDREGIEPIL